MKPSDAKEEHTRKLGPSPAKRAYEKPAVTELGDVRELTLGAGMGTKVDAKTGIKRP